MNRETKHLPLGLLMAGLLMVAQPTLATDLSRMSLDDLLAVEVSGASRHVQPLSETPSAVTIVSADDIHRFGFRTLAESLQMARGVYATNDRAYTYIGVRGLARPGDYNSRILLLQDGLRANDFIYDQAMLGHEAPIEIDWIKRLEFVPGPTSALYGGNALFGVVNAVLWSGADIDGSRIGVEVGSGGLRKVGMMAGRREANGLEWLGALSLYGRRGEDLYFNAFDVPGGGDGIAHRRDGERYAKGLIKAGWENWRLTLNLANRQKDVPTAYFGTNFDEPGNFTRDSSFHAELAHTQGLAPHWEQQARLRLGAYRYAGDYPYGAPTVVNRDSAQADWWSAEYQLRYSGWTKHAWIVGVEARRQTRLAQRNYDAAPYDEKLDINERGRGFGIFVQDEWRFAPNWLANAGIRIDNQNGQPTMSSPRAALIWNTFGTTHLKLLVGKAFRPPNQYEMRYADNGVFQKGNPDLRPERMLSREIALETTLLPTLRLGLGYYRYTIEDLIDQEIDPADGLLVFRNRDKVDAHGFEIEADMALAEGWRLRGSLATQRIQQLGGTVANSPSRIAKLFLDGPIFRERWTLGLRMHALSARKTLGGTIPGQTEGHLVLRQLPVAGTGAWSIAIHNLANRRLLDPVGREIDQDAILADGRQLRVRWELRY